MEEQVELGRRMTLGDETAREELILNCVPIVTDVADRFANHNPALFDELFQEGMIGVIEASNRYDYTRNTKFSSFAYTRIIHHIMRWIRRQIRYLNSKPGCQYTYGTILDSTIDSFRTVFHNCPTDSQLAKLLSMSVEEVGYYRRHHTNLVPYGHRNAPPSCVPNSGLGVDASEVVERAMVKEFNRAQLFRAMQDLDTVDREIILRRHLYTDQKATLQELANVFDLNPSTILRRERKALKRILQYFTENNIQPEL